MLKLSLKLKSEQVELEGKTYMLNELTGQQRDGYLNVSAQRVKTDATGKPIGIKNFDGLQTHLISLSLRDSEGKPVPETEIKTWPATTVESLYAAAQTLSALVVNDKAEEAAKNS